MTVKELINKLERMPKKAEVWVEEIHIVKCGFTFSYRPTKVEKVNVWGTEEKRVHIR